MCESLRKAYMCARPNTSLSIRLHQARYKIWQCATYASVLRGRAAILSVFQLPFTNATIVLHKPVELVAVAPSFCRDTNCKKRKWSSHGFISTSQIDSKKCTEQVLKAKLKICGRAEANTVCTADARVQMLVGQKSNSRERLNMIGSERSSPRACSLKLRHVVGFGTSIA
jgi:hypothetical protein